MKLFIGWMLSAGLVLTAAAANAQVLERYEVERGPYSASDMGGPMREMPAEGPRYHISLLPPPEVDSIVRERGFSPLGMPHLRGGVYTISVLDRVGDDGRLVIDARTGRLISFMPADQYGDDVNEGLMEMYGPSGPPPRPSAGPPRPPASIPHVLASRTPPQVPLPKASPRAGEGKPLAAGPAPVRAQVSASVPSKPADAQASMSAPAAAKPAAILPTQPMPQVQGLD